MTLTPRESQILSFVSAHIEVYGRAPYQKEIAERFGMRSRTFIQRVLKRLQAKGLVSLETYKIRGISLIKQELRAR